MTTKLKDRVRAKATGLAKDLKELEKHMESKDAESKTRIQESVTKMGAMIELCRKSLGPTKNTQTRLH